MIRKQLYLEQAQDEALKRRASQLGVSEAEIVRRSLDNTLGLSPKQTSLAKQALEAFLAKAEQLAASSEGTSEFRFDRSSLYEDDERFERWTGNE